MKLQLFNVKMLLLLLGLSCYLTGYGQPQATQTIPTAPEAASLLKFVEAPVDNFTGIPAIGIPLYTAQEGGLSVPVSVNYHASGVKVDEVASEVGIGWALNAGGVISRQINGGPDDVGPYNYLSLTPYIPDSTFQLDVLTYGYDLEPDVFTFSFPGYSGKFMFNESDEIEFLPKQPLDIEVNSLTNFTLFTITTPEGNKYYFGKDTYQGIEYDGIGESGAPDGTCSYNRTAWNLIRIESQDSKDVITLDYEKVEYPYKMPARREFYSSQDLPDNYPADLPNSLCVREAKIKTIKTSTQEITFNRLITRSDLGLGAGLSGPKQLNEIQLTSGSFQNKWVLNYDYFEDLDLTNNDEEGKRLRLVSLQQQSINGSTSSDPNPYTFDYYKNGSNYFLPHRFDKSLDYWGYYNGVAANNYSNNLINIPNIPTNGRTCTGCKGDRTTSATDMKYGVLTKITNPTGGATFFDFEANRYKPTALNDQLPGGTEVEVLSSPILQSCAGPGSIFVNQCCGIQTTQQTRSFTQSQFDEGMYFVMRVEKPVDPSNSDGCMNPNMVSFTLRVKEASNPSVVVHSLNFNIQLAYQNAQTSFNLNGNPLTFELESQPQIIQNVFSSLQSGTNYIFELETEEIYGEVKFYEKTYVPDTPEGEIYIGGLRVKQIRISESNASSPDPLDIIKEYEYSDGTFFNRYPKVAVPIYGVSFLQLYPTAMSQSFNGAIFIEDPLIPFSNMDGYHIGYEEITEIANGGNGKTIMSYNIEPVPPPNSSSIAIFGFPNYTPEEFPGQIPSTLLADNGKSLGAKIYQEGISTPEATNTNSIKAENYESIEGYYFRLKRININGYTGLFPYKFNYRTKYHRLASTTKILDGVETTINYYYDVDDNALDRHPFPVRVTTTNSDGKVHESINEYVFDFTGTIFDEMETLNMISTPIKTIQKVDNIVVDGTETIFDFFNSSGSPGGSGTDPIYPKEIKRLEVTWDDQGNLSGSNNWQTQSEILAYDMVTGRPASVRQTGWDTELYTWDPITKQIKTRTYNDFTWTYNYFTGTRLLSEIIDLDGQDTDFTYDQLMRLKTVNARDGNVISTYDYHYNNGGTDKNYVKSRTDFTPTGDSEFHWKESQQFLDGLGRPIQTMMMGHMDNDNKSNLVSSTIAYDNQGRVVKQYEPFPGGNSSGYRNPTNDFTLTEYYDSPLNRVKSVTPPSWDATTYSYGNDGSFTIDGLSFGPASLAVTTVIDPEGIASKTYKDKRGRTVLSKTQDGSNSSETYTFYDDKDRVKSVLPPDVLSSTSALAFRYQYDGAGNVLAKYIPDMGWTNYLYNQRDLMTASQDPKLLSEGKWLTTIYDNYGRILETGLYNVNTGNLIDGNTPIAHQILTQTFYDGVCGQTDPIYKGKVCQSRTRILGKNQWLESNLEYDTYGRTIRTLGNNHIDLTSGSEEMNFTYDWADNLVSSNRIHQAFGQQLVINERMTYDHAGRLVDTYHRVGSGIEQLISRRRYTTKDELWIKYIGGHGASDFLQTVNYSYLENGFLSDINGTMEASDLFQLNLKYKNPAAGVSAVAQANGNISQLIWQTKGGTKQSYGYEYDFLNRLKKAHFGDFSSGSLNQNNHYSTEYTYDARGNITTLDRNGAVDGQGFPAIDDLNYTYYGTSNRLKTIADNAATAAKDHGFKPGTGGDYLYDANGNMNYDPHKEINISYNYLNLPNLIEFSDCRAIVNTWDASGGKLQKIIKNGTAITSTQDYIGGIEYKNGILEAIYHSEGRLYFDQDEIRYEYTLSDHLGNNRLTFTDLDNNGSIDETTEVLETTHYYPFGMRMEDNGAVNKGRENSYLYNGKELNEEFGLNWLSYGAREYDPAIGRWMSVDPLAEKYYSKSPYHYAGNNPIIFVDFDGQDYGVLINRKARTIRIKAHYLVSSSNIGSFNKHGRDKWNDQSGKYTFVAGGKKALRESIMTGDGGTGFKVQIALTSSTLDGEGPVPHMSVRDQAVINDETGMLNSFDDVKGPLPGTKGQKGATGSDKIDMLTSAVNSGHTTHEVSHSLGSGHTSDGGSLDPNAGGGVSIHQVNEALTGVGIGGNTISRNSTGDTSPIGDGTLLNGSTNSGLQNGSLMKTKKYERLVRKYTKQAQKNN